MIEEMPPTDSNKVVVIGAGPAGLTAALELLEKGEYHPVVLESGQQVGGISRTVEFKGNRIDIGGHRFFSKSDRIMSRWLELLPQQGSPAKDDLLLGREGNISREPGAPDPEKTDRVMLVRRRLSRIFFLGKLFNYPVTLGISTLRGLGPARTARIVGSYLKRRLFPIRSERSLEDYFINQFGEALYRFFFKDYTEKVWGIPCDRIPPKWGRQRVKGLSITGVIAHALGRHLARKGDLSQKGFNTSLIERFLYPKLGPGQMWEAFASAIRERGGEIRTGHRVTGLRRVGDRIVAAITLDEATGESSDVEGSHFISSMPVRELIAGIDPPPPEEVLRVAEGLQYRGLITVGLLVRKLKIRNDTGTRTPGDTVPDNWIYIQETSVKLGRLQIFNNWSPYMVADCGTVWLGLEYFCNEGEELWGLADDAMVEFAVEELCRIGFLERPDALDGLVIRESMAYPAYFGAYERFGVIRDFTDGIANLYLVGRNGMHRYNNQDHSMMSAMAAVETILSGNRSKDAIWRVNLEPDYHEDAGGGSRRPASSPAAPP
jgi:protoporphyrinogen oxidase